MTVKLVHIYNAIVSDIDNTYNLMKLVNIFVSQFIQLLLSVLYLHSLQKNTP